MSTTTASTTAEATALRRIAAVGTAISAVVHGYLFLDGWSIVPVVGPLFAVNAVSGAVIAVALIASAHWAWRFLAVGFNALSLGALLISHTPTGFFGLREGFWDSWQVIALVSESVGLIAAGLALLVWWRARR
ncbi:hypothetical protein [Pseudactinotalea terrae]|uniref:hypothetical protein n=1 Tax=Pseudactinotalea terrae TaxID=1743262 RepID=UPI0012E12A45|nr:hypothetical protein [Pseudactinotalea terrae]